MVKQVVDVKNKTYIAAIICLTAFLSVELFANDLPTGLCIKRSSIGQVITGSIIDIYKSSSGTIVNYNSSNRSEYNTVNINQRNPSSRYLAPDTNPRISIR